MIGDIVVAGLVTGTHVIEDIRVAVPHKVAVRIPANDALRSKDLWRGISQGRLFKLDGGSGLHATPAPSQAANASRISQLEAQNAELRDENKNLRREVEAANARYEGLQQVLTGLQGQLQGIQGALGRLGDLPAALQGMVMVTPQHGMAAPVAPVSAEDSGVVGGEAPKFIPESIKPKEATTQIQVKSETTDGTNLSAAASRLKELRKKA